MFEKHINQFDLMDKTMKTMTLDYAIEIASLTEINHQPLYDEITCQKWSAHYFYDERRYRNIIIDVVELPHSNAPEVLPRINCSISSTPYSGICIYVLTIMGTFLLLSI